MKITKRNEQRLFILCVDMLRMLLYYTRVYTHARTRI